MQIMLKEWLLQAVFCLLLQPHGKYQEFLHYRTH